jgi:uncharacterized protein YndB with AHSA1/START domain
MGVAEYGQLIRTGDRARLEYRRRLDYTPDKVWRALTEPDQLAAWFPTTIDGERAVGAELTFRFENMSLEPMHGEMLRLDPPRLLEFTWGADVLRFALEPDVAGTVMTFTVTLDELGKATRDGAGWHQSLMGLERALAGEQTRDYDPDVWRELRDVYAKRFGPAASVMQPPAEWEDEYGGVERR